MFNDHITLNTRSLVDSTIENSYSTRAELMANNNNNNYWKSFYHDQHIQAAHTDGRPMENEKDIMDHERHMKNMEYIEHHQANIESNDGDMQDYMKNGELLRSGNKML